MDKPIYLHICFRSGDGQSRSVHTDTLMRIVNPMSLEDLIEFGRKRIQSSVNYEPKGVCILSMNEISEELFNMLATNQKPIEEV